MKDSQKISYKYDLMHRNTPSYARTTIQWDTKLLTPLTRKRVIRALHDPEFRIGHGDAGQMYKALLEKFEIPDCKAYIEKYRDETFTTHLHIAHCNQAVRDEANKILQAHITMDRLSGNRYWGSVEVTPEQKYLRLYNQPHDLTAVLTEMHKFMDSDEPKKRVRDALMFIEDGGVLTFTYNPTDR